YYAAGSLQVYENGTYKGSFGSYRSGDVGEVELLDSIVRYIHNGTVVYTSKVKPEASYYRGGFALHAHWCPNTPVSTHHQAPQLLNVRISYHKSDVIFRSQVVSKPTNTPTYTWYVNDVPFEFGNGKDSLVDHKYAFQDGDEVKLRAVSNDYCVTSPGVAVSVPIIVRVAMQEDFIKPVADTVYVCRGDSTTIGVRGAVSYTWEPVRYFDSAQRHDSTIHYLPLETASYRIYGNSTEGCVDF
ncbi:MAG: hypothetical protein K2I83_04270, partial [Bacteroidales bacterium]|nr:hypothetical protein [Bacteroidales bacterium]